MAQLKIGDRLKYYQSLGDMFDTFANAERELVHMVGRLAGLSHDMTNALLSGVRTDAAISQTRRVYKALKIAIPDEVESALIQMKIISNDRNLLAHHGSIESVQHGRISSNFRIVLPDASANEISVTPKQLNSMALDLTGIILVFDYTSRHGEPEGVPEYDLIVQNAVEFARIGSWHYKSEKR